ncbi:MAG: carboxypeptidase regulatory-like domain-containing protein, partial [Opitutales bacterium]|nr:carboxypeptidase regulatory-like domain-containing protein [Opitutales bacterium]
MNFEKPFFSGYSSRIAWLGLLSFLTVLTAKADPLRVEVTTAYNAIVDSNVGTPASYAPSAFYISARVWNDGTEPMENVVVRVGDFTENTPGVYPSRAHPELTGPLDGEFALTHEGGSLGAADATRNLGTIAPGSYKPVYWLVSYPALDENGNDVTGGTKPDDDLFLYYDVWATGTASSTLHEANKTRRIFMRSCISAMANKIFPNTANKVPQEYKDLLERFEPEWADFAADGSPGTSIVTEGIWYDLGNVNKGFDNDGDLVPDQNAWLQPVGDPSLFDPSAFRLVKTYALIIVKLKDGGELVLDEEDLLYFTKLPDNTGVVGLVRYDFKTLQGGANGQLTPYQMAASGQDNEKFNGDFGASIGESLQSPETQVTFDKSVDELVQDPGGELTYTLAFDNPGEISVGAPDEGLPLVVQDVIPAHTSYLAGSAVANNASPAGGVFQVYYSTDGGFNWTTVEPSAEDVTDLQWWLNQPLASGDSGEVTFSVTVDDPFTGTFSQVENTGGLSFGSATPFLTATAETQITGNNLISGTVFADDGAGDGIFGNGEQDGTEAGLGDITVRLYLDTDGSETLSSNDLLWATSSTDGNGNYSFGDLPDGNWLIVVDTEDPDLPEGFAPTNGSLFPVALDPGSVEPDPVEVTDVDIGFAPILSLSKTGPATAREGEEVTYEITVNNNFPGDGSGGGLLIEFDAWTGTATSPTGNKGWPNPENVIGENDGAVALGRYENAAEEITLTDFGLEVEPYNIDVVTFNMVLRRTDSFGADEQLIVNFIQQPANTVFHTITIPATTLNSFSTSTMDTYSVDVSGIKDWVWEDFGDGANRISVELETGRQANNPGQLELDALGFTVTTDTVISASNSFSSILSPVPVLDTYDANALTFLSADPAPNTITVDGGTGELFWANIGTIFAGGSRTVSVTFLVNEPPGNESGTTTLNHAQTVGASFLNGTSVNQDEDEAVTEILPAGTLGGQIYRDGDLSGIVGVTVQLTPPSGVDLGAGVDETVTATTDFDGNYLFEGLPASGDYTVTVLEDTLPGGSGTVVFNEYGADNSNVGTVTINHDATDGSDTVLNADFAYDPASLDTLISGQIWNDLNQNGAPAPDQGEPGLEGVTVRLFDSSDNEVAVTTTAADGTYSFVEDFSGDFEVRVDTSSGPLGIGWIETYDSDGLVTSHLVAGTVSAGGAATADFSYAQGGARRIAGVLFHDWDGDGTQDPNEEGVPDVTVRLYADVDNDGVFDPLVDGLVKTVTTDLQGNYEFANLPSGSYFVIVDAADPNLPDPYIFTADPDPTLDGFNRVVLGSVSALDRDFGIQTQGDALIDGVVWRDRNADGVQSGPQETGISGITVWLQVDINGDGTYQTVETAVTDANGLYEFSGLPDGSYRVVVDDQDDDLPEDAFGNSWYATTDTSVSLSVSGGTASASPSFGFAGLAAVGNTIFFDANQNGTQDTNEEGIEGVTVLLYQDNVLVAAEVTDVNGNYFFTGLLPGTYTVVVDENSSALDGAFLTADPDADGVPCSDPLATDCDGETTINLAPSQIFSGADFGYFLPGGVISGVLWIDFNDDGVVDEEEIRIPFVEVNLYDSSDDLVASVETDENGFYNFAGLDDGTYRVVVDPAEIPGGLDQTFDPDGVLDNETTVVISGGNQVEANFGYRYAGDNSLSGTVGLETSEFPTGLLNGINPSGVDENAGEVAFENVTVFIYAWTDDNSDGIVDPGEAVLLGTTVTDADGDYQFADLPDSQFYIVAMDAPIANLILVSDESTVDHPLNTVVTATNSQGHTTGAYMTVEADETIENMDFAFVSAVEYDFGDLPETYSTLLPGGARHIVPVIPNLFLGEGVSTEPDGQPSVDADKDDFDDGVEVLGIWQNGADGATLEFDVTGSGWLLGFIDWEDNGTFLDAGNLVVSQAVSSGLVSVNLDVPEGALDTEGTTLLYSRFRLMPSEPFIPELGFTGEASNGEVEDYRWAFNSVSGNVWVDAVGNNPQGGVIIELVKDEVVLATTVTQVNGTYSFYGLPEGDYEIRLVEPDGATAKEDADGSDNGDDLIELEVTDSSFTDQYFVLDTEVTQSNLSGTVFLDSDRNGLFSGGDTEIENVVVRLYRDLDGDGLPDANEFVGEVLTDANGNYVFEDLPNGTFLIQMVPSAGVVAIRDVDGDANGDDLIEVDLAGSSVSGQDFLTEYTAFISGTVWVDSLGGAPQENVTIELLDDQGGVLFTVQTDINGVYSFPALPPETYQVRQTVPTGYMAIDDVDGGDLTVIGDVEPIELGLDEERTQQDFVNQLDGATITGRVWYDVNLDGQLDSGEPFANGVTVRLLDGDENVLVTAFTNPDGEYSFANLEPGNYQVEFVLPAGHDFTADTGDSSADPATGRTGVFSLTFGEAEDDVDAGLLSADLAVQKSVAPAATNIGESVTYTVTLDNFGPVNATGIVVTEFFPLGLDVGMVTPSTGSFNGSEWMLDLDAGQSATLTVEAEVTGGDAGSGLLNVVEITASDIPDPVLANNTASANLLISGLSLEKTSDAVGFVTPGQTITYTVVLENTGSATQSGILLEDLLPEGVTFEEVSSVTLNDPGTLTEVTEDFESSQTFFVPSGVTSLQVEAWGGGGGGASSDEGNRGGGGGGGGGYARVDAFTVTPGDFHTVTVGTGGQLPGPGNPGAPGGTSWFSNSDLLFAEGGDGGGTFEDIDASGSGASGGGTLADFTFTGGNGGAGRAGGNDSPGGGGGSSASDNSDGGDGGDGSNQGPGAGGVVPSGFGGDGGDGGSNDGPGVNPAMAPGGGGGGCGGSGASVGARGLVRITYTLENVEGSTGGPAALLSGYTLAPGGSVEVIYTVAVNDPAEAAALTNTASVTSELVETPVIASVTDSVAVGAILGSASVDTTGDNSGDTPLEDVTVRLLDADDGDAVVSTTTTNPNGEYAFTLLPPGNYIIEMLTPAGYLAIDDADGGDFNLIGDQDAISVDAGDEIDEQFFVLEIVPPVTEDDFSSGHAIGTTVSVNVLANDTPASGLSLVLSSVQLADADEGSEGLTKTVPGEGVWSVNTSNGVISFTPEPGYLGNPTPVEYTVEDSNGVQSNESTVTVIYTVAPVANDDESLANTPGETVILDVPDNDTADTGRTLDLTSVEL